MTSPTVQDQGPSALRSDTHRAPEGPVVGWQPIETAPLDGTPILITRPTEFEREDRFHVVRRDEHPYADYDWWIVHDGKSDHALRGPDPTHWMPLPAAPDTASPAEQVGIGPLADEPKNTPAPTEKRFAAVPLYAAPVSLPAREEVAKRLWETDGPTPEGFTWDDETNKAHWLDQADAIFSLIKGDGRE